MKMKTQNRFLVLCLVLALVIRPSIAFIPRALLEFGVRLNCLQLSSFDTHKDISRRAVRDVAQSITNNPSSSLDGVIDTINKANAGVDLGYEEHIAAAHFDSEQFQAGQNRLVRIRRNIVSLIMNRDYELARMQTGRLFHTLQDFYSRSNWIENNNNSPYDILGEEDQRPGPVADQNTQTCTNCEETGTVILVRIVNFFRNLFRSDVSENADKFYTCPNNIHTNIQQSGELTSGYYVDTIDEEGYFIRKLGGKCSHGGPFDETADTFARGGINKDTPCEKYSPHYDLFDEAIRIARQATYDMLQKIRRDVNNDTLFGRFLGLDVAQTASIAYVIDTTGSMAEELPELQATIPQIRSSLQRYVDSLGEQIRVRYILVPFNDPDPGIIFETEDIEQFLAGIASLSADGGGDEPEPSIGATIRAAEASEPGSPIYVYTDAPASDEYRLNDAIALITRKNVRITFGYVATFRKRRSQDKEQQSIKPLPSPSRMKRQFETEISIYEYLAAFSGGQFLNVQTSEISELASLISFSAIRNRRTIFQRSGNTFGTNVYPFPVDSSIAEIVFSINGAIINPIITTPQGVNVIGIPQYSPSLISSTSYIASVNITDDSLRGEWSLSLQTSGSFTIQILGRSQLRFSYELFKIDPSSNYGFRVIDGKPAQGEPLVVQFEVESGTVTPNITTLNLIDDQGMLLQSFDNLTQLDSANYLAAFIPTDLSFTFQLVGRDERGYRFSYISDTTVELTFIDLSLGKNNTGFVTIRPEESVNVTLVLLNKGDPSTFSVTVNTAVSSDIVNSTELFEYVLTPEIVYLVNNQSAEINIEISLSTNVTDGVAATFTIVAESAIHNDFVTLYVVTTNKPPPEFTENLVSGAVPMTTVISVFQPIVAILCLMFYYYF